MRHTGHAPPSPQSGADLDRARQQRLIHDPPRKTERLEGEIGSGCKHLALDLRYADTDEHDLGKTYGSHYTVSITSAF